MTDDDEIYEIETNFDDFVEEYLELTEEEFWDAGIDLLAELAELCERREAFETARKWRTGRGDKGH